MISVSNRDPTRALSYASCQWEASGRTSFLSAKSLTRIGEVLPAELDHAGSLEEAKTMLQRGDYGFVLFEHKTGIAQPPGFSPNSCTRGALCRSSC